MRVAERGDVRRVGKLGLLQVALLATFACSEPGGASAGAGAESRPERPVQPVEPSDARLQAIRRGVEERIASGEIPSMSIAVTHQGRLLWLEGLGWANREAGRPATPETVYLIGSMSKSIMATGVLTLVERGLVGLDDPVAPILAGRGLIIHEYESDGEAIRLRHLLDMRAGIPHGWMTLPPADEPPTPGELARLFDVVALSVFPPGEVYHYSNFSISLPAAVVEAVANEPFAAYMRRHLFGPLGMNGAGVSEFDVDPLHLATAYDADGTPIPGPSYQVAAGGAGFLASVSDLVQYARFHLGEVDGNEPAVLGEELHDRQLTAPARPDSMFGLGWFFGPQLVSNGRVAGGSSWLSLVPSEGLAVICLTNTTSSAADEVCGEIVEALSPAVAAAGAGAYERYVSRYENPYEPRRELVGRWEGSMDVGDRSLPVTLELPRDGSAALSIGNSEPVTLGRVVFNTRGIFKAAAEESMVLPTAVTDRPLDVSVSLVLRLDDGRLYGYVAETFGFQRGGYRLGSYVSLERVPEGTPGGR